MNTLFFEVGLQQIRVTIFKMVTKLNILFLISFAFVLSLPGMSQKVEI